MSVFHRINTAQTDYQSAQPFDPLGVGAVALPLARAAGHLNTNGIAPQPPTGLAEGPIRRNCPTCGQVRDYYY
jgi:hypothetical protein